MTEKYYQQPQKGFAPIVLVIVALLIASTVGFVAYTQLVKPKTPSSTSPRRTQIRRKTLPKAKPASVKRRSKKPGVVQNLVVANATDKTGRPLSYSTVYKTNVPSLGLVLKLNPTKPGTNVDYVRYVNGKYLDHRRVTTVTPNLKYLVFYWPLKGVALARPKGDYIVKTYVNGIFDAATTYKVI